MTATPDQLPRDGSSQAVVTLIARDPQGRPVSGQRITLGLSNSTPAGTRLSAAEVVTGSDGRAMFTVTAPTQAAVGGEIVITATPIGGNFDNSVTRIVTIALLGPSNTAEPNAAFTFTPANPERQREVTFDASLTQDEGVACLDTCTYSWDFGDGTTGSGRIARKTYPNAGAFNVVLNVRDASGTPDPTPARQTVTVSAPAAPVVTVAVAPNPPLLGQPATFTATATVAPNHSITRFDWNFGDGNSQSTTVPTVTKTYTTSGTFVVTVTVTDDLGQTGIGTLTVTVGSGITFPTPPFTMSPTNPRVNETVNFNASGVTAASGATISSYAWDFGDGGTGSSMTTNHSFGSARTFVVRLTVTDSQNRTASATRELTVVP
jgi:PKD repeat protein